MLDRGTDHLWQCPECCDVVPEEQVTPNKLDVIKYEKSKGKTNLYFISWGMNIVHSMYNCEMRCAIIFQSKIVLSLLNQLTLIAPIAVRRHRSASTALSTQMDTFACVQMGLFSTRANVILPNMKTVSHTARTEAPVKRSQCLENPSAGK